VGPRASSEIICVRDCSPLYCRLLVSKLHPILTGDVNQSWTSLFVFVTCGQLADKVEGVPAFLLI
jgi:hypothetical protein